MLHLEPDECRVLGVLVEKAHTTPDQYPLSLNVLVSGCSQKSNRNPVRAYDEAQVYDTLEALRRKGLVIEAHMSGSRVPKFRHNARETLGVDTAQLVLLVEMLLRGPQTVGELRGRASRMKPFESTDAVMEQLNALMQRDPPYVRHIAPAPGSRAERFGQLLCEDLHPLEEAAVAPAAPVAARQDDQLATRLAQLELQVAELREEVQKLGAALGDSV